MDKIAVRNLLWKHIPPLTIDQVDAIADEISKISEAEVKEAVEKALKTKGTKP